MKQPNQQEFINNAMKVGKRIALTVLICIPFLILFAYLTKDIITSDVAQVLIFIAVMGVAVLLEEIIVRKREKQKKEMQIEKKDVFR
ncbi:MAG: hypothetical protein J6Q13_03580 [Clostridia bacterium]|nr:hypothetical protein [Clostridia bacterium]